MRRCSNIGVSRPGAGTNLQAHPRRRRRGRLDADVALVDLEQARRPRPRARRARRACRALLPHKDLRRRAIRVRRRAGRRRSATPASSWSCSRVHAPPDADVPFDAFPSRSSTSTRRCLPAFPGVDAQAPGARSTASRSPAAPCTSSMRGWTPEPVIAQRSIPVLDDDTVERLTARLLVEEHRALVDALDAIAKDRVEIVPGAEAIPRAREARVAVTARHYDVVVLGRSLGALSAAAILARRDFRVLLLGQGARPASYRYERFRLKRRAFTRSLPPRRHGSRSCTSWRSPRRSSGARCHSIPCS